MVLSYFGTGAISAPSMVMVFPKVPGIVKKVHAVEGQRVQKDEPLVTLDDEEIRLMAGQARAALDGAESNFKRLTAPPREELVLKAKSGLQQAKDALGVAEKAFERAKGLRDADMIPAMEFEKVQAEYNATQSRVEMAEKDLEMLLKGPTQDEIDAAQSQVDAARKALEIAEVKLENVVVKAPIAGILLSIDVTEGEMMLDKAKPIVMAELEELEVKMNVPERQMNLVRDGQEVQITVDAFPTEVFKGTVKAVSPMVDLKNGTVTAEVSVQNSELKLRPGMFCRLRVVLETHDAALTVPKPAVLHSRNSKQVFVVKQGVAQLRSIETGLEDETRIEVLSGIEDGEDVIVVGQNTIRDGAKVRVVTSAS
jgi:multidrug efflux pump subunit AcrA (membrane-fusion protein)